MALTRNRLRLFFRYRLYYPLLARLPSRLAYRIATVWGVRAALRHPARLEGACADLGRVLTGLSPERRRSLVLSQQGMLAREVLDVYRLCWMRADNVHRYIRLEGVEHLERAVASGRPVIFYSAHFGRLIMPAMALGALGTRTSCLTADISGPHLPPEERHFLAFKLRQMQRLMGGEMIQKSDSLRRLYRVLNRREILIVIVDAPPGRNEAAQEFPFLGGTARLAIGTVRLAQRTGALLVPYFALEEGAGRLGGRVLPAIDPAGQDEDTLLRRVFEPVEEQIRSHPEQWWLWQSLKAFWRPASTAHGN